MIRSWRRFWSLVPIVTLCLFASRAALGAVHDADAAKLREAAIYSDYLATDFASAEKKLTQALGLCERPADCSSSTRARLHCDLGVVEFASQKAADGRVEFARAIKEDPAVTIDADLTTPELQKELLTAKVSAAKSAGAGGANPPPVAGGGSPPAGGANPPPVAGSGSPPAGGANPPPVARSGSPPAVGGRPSELPDGGAPAPAYAGNAPSIADAGKAIADGGKAVADSGGAPALVYAGGAAGPHAIPVGGASSGAAVAPKTAAPSAVASAIAPGPSTASRPVVPSTTSSASSAAPGKTASTAPAPSKSAAVSPASGGSAAIAPAPGKTAAGGPATNLSTSRATPPSPATTAATPPSPATPAPPRSPITPAAPPPTLASAPSSADCPPGFPGCKSEPTSCSSDDDCASGETCESGTCRAKGSETPGKANWVSLALQLDVPLLPAKNNVCAGGQGYSCFNSDGSWYSDTPTEGGGGAIQSAGLKPGTLRVLLGYDRRLLDNLTLGGAIGFAFRGGPTRPGGTAFLPLSLEVRGKYWLGHYPLGRRGLRFYGMLDGGLADVAASLTTYVYATPTAQGTAKTAWYHVGRGYAGLGLGGMFAFTPNMGIFLEVRASESFPTSGTAIAGQIGYGVGL